jgi:exonuclease III
MKVVTWNCNGAFRNKFETISGFDADIYVIQECEDPEQCKHIQYKQWAKNYLWIGDSKNKGLGIFCKGNSQVSINEWEKNGTKHFISAKINHDFDLIAVWNHHANSPNFKYIGQFWKYLQVNKSRLDDCLIVGDFNSNKIWDQWDRGWNHSDVVRELEEIGIRSIYHEFYNLQQGLELHPTFFLQRNPAKPYHIDFVFASKNRFGRIVSCEIGDTSFWLSISDHLPIIVDL